MSKDGRTNDISIIVDDIFDIYMHVLHLMSHEPESDIAFIVIEIP